MGAAGKINGGFSAGLARRRKAIQDVTCQGCAQDSSPALSQSFLPSDFHKLPEGSRQLFFWNFGSAAPLPALYLAQHQALASVGVTDNCDKYTNANMDPSRSPRQRVLQPRLPICALIISSWQPLVLLHSFAGNYVDKNHHKIEFCDLISSR